jgi:hypothetical protein
VCIHIFHLFSQTTHCRANGRDIKYSSLRDNPVKIIDIFCFKNWAQGFPKNACISPKQLVIEGIINAKKFFS